MAIEVSIHIKKEAFCLNVEFKTNSKRIGILGASGCGKSMTLKSIAGIETIQKGSIRLDETSFYDKDLHIDLSPQKRKIGYMFQNYALFPTMTVRKNIQIGIRKKSKQEQELILKEMIGQFRLKGCEEKYPFELSGGQQQRVALARIMAYHPKLIMLDEPFSALDSFLKENLKYEMKEFLKEYQGTMILVSHNRDEIYELSEWLIVMEQGKIVEMGNTKELFLKPKKRQTARLTGCKNISAIQRIGKRRCMALDWGIEFEVEEEISDRARYLGFRAHHFIMSDKKQEIDNAFLAEIISITDSPFEETYFLKAITSNESCINDTRPICLKIRKENSNRKRAIGDKVYVSISQKDIFILED